MSTDSKPIRCLTSLSDGLKSLMYLLVAVYFVADYSYEADWTDPLGTAIFAAVYLHILVVLATFFMKKRTEKRD